MLTLFCVYTCQHTHEDTCVVNELVGMAFLLPLCMRQGLSCCPCYSTTHSKLTGPGLSPQRSHFYRPSQQESAGMTDTCHHVCLFLWVLEIELTLSESPFGLPH